MTRVRQLTQLVAWLLLLAAALIALDAAGRGQLSSPPVTSGTHALRTWLGARDAPTIVIAVIRLIANGLAWYLLATTVIGAAARATRLASAVRLVDAVSIPAVRRLVGGATGLILTAAPLAVTAPFVPPTADAPLLQRLPPADATVPRLSILPPAQSPAPAAPPTDTPLLVPLPGAATTWTVLPGESFWLVASRSLEAAWGRPATDAEVAPFWEETIELNRPRLADPRNPSLLYPGQVLTLPAPPPAP